ncbi:MAG: class I SAM-dependent methyltransferase, partial [Candidatus Hodarchaeota archaeon]
MKESNYDKKYKEQNYYWGKEPSILCNKIIEVTKKKLQSPLKLLDLGCGEGRDSVYFASKGFTVTGLDLSLAGLQKVKKYAEELGVSIKTIHADLIDYRVEKRFDVIYSSGSLHYIPPKMREEIIENYKR